MFQNNHKNKRHDKKVETQQKNKKKIGKFTFRQHFSYRKILMQEYFLFELSA